MSQKEVCENRQPSVSFLCDCLGISRQGYYKHTSEVCELDILRTSVVLYCRHILSDLMPRAGMKVLYHMCREKFGDKMRIGRDQCYALFRANGLVQRKRKRPRTTDSRHGLRVYELPHRSTSECLAAHFFGKLKARGLPVTALSVSETPESLATYRP